SRGHVMPAHSPRFSGLHYETAYTQGRLPPEVIQRIVRENDGRYRYCYQRGLRDNPALRGRVSVRFLIDREGRVATAADGASALPDTQVRRCVVTSFMNLSFPAPASGSVVVEYPIFFTPD